MKREERGLGYCSLMEDSGEWQPPLRRLHDHVPVSLQIRVPQPRIPGRRAWSLPAIEDDRRVGAVALKELLEKVWAVTRDDNQNAVHFVSLRGGRRVVVAPPDDPSFNENILQAVGRDKDKCADRPTCPGLIPVLLKGVVLS